jgi:site-specific DNA-methyltransferase (adenine-specific)
MSDIHPRYKTPRNPKGVEGYGNIIKSEGDMPLTKGNSEWEGWGTALKPAIEPITLARKPISEKNIALNVLKWGTGGINIDESRVEIDPKIDDPRLGGKGEWHIKREQSKNTVSLPPKTMGSSPQGRFPANFIWSCNEDEYVIKASITDTDVQKIKEYFNGKKS